MDFGNWFPASISIRRFSMGEARADREPIDGIRKGRIMTPSWGIGRLAPLLSTAVIAQAAEPQLEFEALPSTGPAWTGSDRHDVTLSLIVR
jgi:hypothetical protein